MSTSSTTKHLSTPPISESTILRGDRSRPQASRFARLSDFVVEHSTDWIRLGMVSFVLLASAVLAFKGSAQQQNMIVTIRLTIFVALVFTYKKIMLQVRLTKVLFQYFLFTYQKKMRKMSKMLKKHFWRNYREKFHKIY